MKRKKAMRCVAPASVVALLALVALGCGPTHVYFRPALSPEAAAEGWVAKGRYRLPPETGAVEVELAARGRIETRKGEVPRETIHVALRAANRGEETFALEPAQVRLVDDEGRQLDGFAACRDGTPIGLLALAPRGTETCELVLELPAGVRLETLGSFRLCWPYRYGDRRYEAATKFIRIEEVRYYYPYHPYGPWYDPWYGPRYGPWYDPWYDPWYGPGGRWRFGMGYYHGR